MLVTDVECVLNLRNKNPSLPKTGLPLLLSKTPAYFERKKANSEEIKILIDNVLLAVKMNISLLSVQDINEHMTKYVKIPDSWRSKNYAFTFLEIINFIVKKEIIEEIRRADFHTLTVDESTDISTTKCLILYFKFRCKNSNQYKTIFGGIIKLKTCDSYSIQSEIYKFYADNNIDLQKMVMFTSDGASVMLGKTNGVAAKFKEKLPHLVQQHCVEHREDLGICDTWKEIKLMKDIEIAMRNIYTLFSTFLLLLLSIIVDFYLQNLFYCKIQY